MRMVKCSNMEGYRLQLVMFVAEVVALSNQVKNLVKSL